MGDLCDDVRIDDASRLDPDMIAVRLGCYGVCCSSTHRYYIHADAGAWKQTPDWIVIRARTGVSNMYQDSSQCAAELPDRFERIYVTENDFQSQSVMIGSCSLRAIHRRVKGARVCSF